MSLTINCDRCGEAIPGEHLRNGVALEHRGAHYCGQCKESIIRALGRPLEKALGKEAGGGKPAGQAAAGPGKTPPAGGAPRPPLRRLPAAQAAGGQPPVASGQPPAPVRQPPAASRQPLAASHPPPVASRQSQAASGQPPASSRQPPGAALVRRGLPVRPQFGVAPQDAGKGARKRKAFLWIGAGGTLVLVVITVVLAFALRRPATAPPVAGSQETALQSPEAVAAEAERLRQMHSTQRAELDKLRARLTDDPEKLLVVLPEIEVFVPSTALEADHRRLLEEAAARLEGLAAKHFEETLKRSQELQKQDRFSAAGELWSPIPPLIRHPRSNQGQRWQQEEVRATSYAKAWALWTRISAKADKYLRQEDVEIAVAILECLDNYPAHAKENFPEIWKKREERIQGLRVNSALERLVVAQREIQRQKEEEERERIRQEKERLARWSQLLQERSWEPLLSREGGDLENWPVRTLVGDSLDEARIPWKITVVGDQPVLEGNASDLEQDIELGMNGNRWLDWVIEFEVMVEAESLRLLTRTVMGGSAMRTYVRNQAQPFEFPAKAGSWKKVRVEAQGKKVILIQDGAKAAEVATEHERGGFVFVVGSKGKARIRGLQMKLVFEDKTPSDEEEYDDD